MPYRIILSPDTKISLKEIHDYIVDDKPSAAKKYVRGLRQNIKSLTRMPLRCPLAPESELNNKGLYRHLLYGSHRIIFKIEGRLIYIVDIRHGARLPLEIDS